MDHAGEHLRYVSNDWLFNCKRLMASLLNAQYPEQTSAVVVPNRAVANREKVIAHKVESRHGVGFDATVQSVSNDDLVAVQPFEQSRHFNGSVRSVSVQHHHRIGVQLHRLTEAVTNGTSLSRIVLIDEQNAVFLSDLGGGVRAVAVHHQHRGAVPVSFSDGHRGCGPAPTPTQGFVEHREQDDEVLHA